MKAISNGDVYDIYSDSLRVYDQLPTQTYVVRFSDNRGFFLEKYTNMEITESKIYGIHTEKVFKVLNSFERTNRNLGVILSGDKGIGKSLFAKLLAIEAMNKNLPLIVVDKYIPGIASYIESIEQEVVILFDEFDKTFGEVRSKDGEASPQTHLLSLFDGVSSGKKLFVITCNSLHKLNEYLINRPGRFHYHFRFEYPSSTEIRQYLQDKLPESQHSEIDNVIAFSHKVNLNYDCLRSIAFELSNGLTFKDAISDLNIINMDREVYSIALKYGNGLILRNKGTAMDMFDNDSSEYVYMYDSNGNNYVDVEFSPTDAVFDSHRGCYVIFPDKFKVVYDDAECYKDMITPAKSSPVECLVITRKNQKGIHYVV